MNAPASARRSQPQAAWRTHCRETGIDPVEVQMVASRYRAYRDFIEPQGGGLALDGWFRFYHMEKQSESPDQKGSVVGGCSATGEAVKQDVLSNPAAFLVILKEHLAEQPESL